MELEVRGLPPADRQKYQTRLKSYQAELAALEKELVSRCFCCHRRNSSLVLSNYRLLCRYSYNVTAICLDGMSQWISTVNPVQLTISVQHFVQTFLIAFIMFNKLNVFSKLNIEQVMVALLYQSMGQDDTVM